MWTMNFRLGATFNVFFLISFSSAHIFPSVLNDGIIKSLCNHIANWRLLLKFHRKKGKLPRYFSMIRNLSWMYEKSKKCSQSHYHLMSTNEKKKAYNFDFMPPSLSLSLSLTLSLSIYLSLCVCGLYFFNFFPPKHKWIEISNACLVSHEIITNIRRHQKKTPTEKWRRDTLGYLECEVGGRRGTKFNKPKQMLHSKLFFVIYKTNSCDLEKSVLWFVWILNTLMVGNSLDTHMEQRKYFNFFSLRDVCHGGLSLGHCHVSVKDIKIRKMLWNLGKIYLVKELHHRRKFQKDVIPMFWILGN